MGFGFFSVLSAREVIVVTFQNPKHFSQNNLVLF